MAGQFFVYAQAARVCLSLKPSEEEIDDSGSCWQRQALLVTSGGILDGVAALRAMQVAERRHAHKDNVRAHGSISAVGAILGDGCVVAWRVAGGRPAVIPDSRSGVDAVLVRASDTSSSKGFLSDGFVVTCRKGKLWWQQQRCVESVANPSSQRGCCLPRWAKGLVRPGALVTAAVKHLTALCCSSG